MLLRFARLLPLALPVVFSACNCDNQLGHIGPQAVLVHDTDKTPPEKILKVGLDPTPLSTTAQSCKVTWHVWEEVYIVEVTRPNASRVEKTLTVNGVLRRCAEVQATQTRGLLLAGNATQIPFGVPLLVKAKVQVNPIEPGPGQPTGGE